MTEHVGMLVIYCMEDITPSVHSFGILGLLAAASVVGIQDWK